MTRVYVANGSRHKAKIVFSISETGNPASVTIDIGDLYPLPPTFGNSVSISLVKEAKEGNEIEVIGNLQSNDFRYGRHSIIITEEGCITHGNDLQKDGSIWVWKSSSDGTDHRPRKFFVANASNYAIKAQLVADESKTSDNSKVNINPGEAKTLDFDRLKISCYQEIIFEGTVKPRTSVVFCSDDKVKITGRLYGEDIEAQKWIVDGINYKPTG